MNEMQRTIVFFTDKYAAYREGMKLKMTRRGLWHLGKVGFPISLQMRMETASFNVCAVMMGWLGMPCSVVLFLLCALLS